MKKLLLGALLLLAACHSKKSDTPQPAQFTIDNLHLTLGNKWVYAYYNDIANLNDTFALILYKRDGATYYFKDTSYVIHVAYDSVIATFTNGVYKFDTSGAIVRYNLNLPFKQGDSWSNTDGSGNGNVNYYEDNMPIPNGNATHAFSLTFGNRGWQGDPDQAIFSKNVGLVYMKWHVAYGMDEDTQTLQLIDSFIK